MTHKIFYAVSNNMHVVANSDFALFVFRHFGDHKLNIQDCMKFRSAEEKHGHRKGRI